MTNAILILILVFRPSGHGALLTNLAELGADLVLIKNIDNLQPEERRADTIRWKKILGGTLVTLARETHLYVARLRGTAVDASRVDEAASFARMQFGIPVPDRNAPLEQRRVALLFVGARVAHRRLDNPRHMRVA
jgi:hypothetical protein